MDIEISSTKMIVEILIPGIIFTTGLILPLYLLWGSLIIVQNLNWLVVSFATLFFLALSYIIGTFLNYIAYFFFSYFLRWRYSFSLKAFNSFTQDEQKSFLQLAELHLRISVPVSTSKEAVNREKIKKFQQFVNWIRGGFKNRLELEKAKLVHTAISRAIFFVMARSSELEKERYSYLSDVRLLRTLLPAIAIFIFEVPLLQLSKELLLMIFTFLLLCLLLAFWLYRYALFQLYRTTITSFLVIVEHKHNPQMQ